MPKLLLFSDPHITPKAEFSSVTSDGLTEYLHRCIKSFSWIQNVAKQEAVDAIFCLGDVTETTGYVDSRTMYAMYICMQELSIAGIPAYIMVGNHDSFTVTDSAPLHNLVLLDPIKNIEVVDRPMLVSVGDAKVCCIPWIEEQGQWEDAKFKMKSADVCLTHIDVQGGYIFKTKKSDFGFQTSEFPMVTFNGHQHNPCTVGGEFHNVGALSSRNFHDVDSEPRGVVIYDTSSREIVRHDNPYDIRFMDVVLTESSNLDYLFDLVSDKFIRIRYSKQQEQDALALSAAALDCRLELQSAEVVSKSNVSETFSPEDNFDLYVGEVFLFDEDSDREAVKKLGKEYIEKEKQDESVYHTSPIRFISVEIDNFHSIGHVEARLESQGMVFIQGDNKDDPADSNGAGKSSLSEAIFWCITGKSLREYSSNEVIKWGEKSCRVSVCLCVGDHEYTITRTRGPNKLKVFKGEDDISCRLVKDTEKMVQGLIGRSDSVLQHSIFLTADLKTKFTSLSYPDRIRLIEQITDSEVYSRIADEIKRDAAACRHELSSVDGSIKTLEFSIDKGNSRLQEINGSVIEAKRENDGKIGALRDRLKKLEESLAKKSDEVGKIKFSLDKIDHKSEQVTCELDAAMAERFDNNSRKNEAISRKDSLASEIRVAMSFRDGGKCTACGSDIDENTPITARIDTLKQQLKEAVQKASDATDRYAKSEFTVGEIKHKTDKLRAMRADLFQRSQSLDVECNGIRRSIGDIDIEIGQLENAVDTLVARKREIQATLDDHGERLDELIAKRKLIVAKERHIEWLLEAFGTKGIRAKILASVTLPFVNERLDRYSSVLGVPCKLTAEKETKSGSVQNKIDVVLPEPRTYKGLSRGEKRKVDLAIQCSLNDLAIATGGSYVNLLICDEVLDPLDEAGVDNFVLTLCRKSSGTGMTIMVMSHKPHLDNKFENKWVMQKSGGTTTLTVV